MLGKVIETGPAVKSVSTGDYAVFTVRRGCGKCAPCNMNRPDMCRTGQYRERGIWGLDGYQAESVVDGEQYLVRVPSELAHVGVLMEPLSVAEKAIDEVIQLQVARLPAAPGSRDWLTTQKCLVAGLGPIGLLAAMILRLRGAEVWGMDIVDATSPRPQWLAGIGGRYIDGRATPTDRLADSVGRFDLIFEATGIARLEFDLLDSLALDGAYVLTGIPGGDRPVQLDAPAILRKLVLQNQLMVGSVNAATSHFQMAAKDLERAHLTWGPHAERLITARHAPGDFAAAFQHHDEDEIKVVIEWQPVP